MVVLYAVLLYTYDPQLTAVGIGVALLNVIAMRVVIRLRATRTAKLRADNARLTNTAYTGLQLIETMKATGGEDGYFRKWAGQHATTLEEQQRLGVPSAWLGVVAPTLATLNSALILWIGGLRAVEGHISVGLLVAFQALVTRFTAPLTRLNGVAGRIQDFAADVARLKDVENFQTDPLYARSGSGESTRRLQGHVELENITFGYSPLDKPLLTGFSLTVGPGQQVALVGGSGSGKSTVSRLISGLYSPWEGTIRIDGQRLEDIPRGALAASVSFVDQDVFLFEGTVRDNVALWDPSIPDEAVVAALEDAALYDVVTRRPGGIHSRVEQDGRNFSGGQRQRLEIARALVRRPSILVLDEVTSALDAETEQTVIDNLRKRGCACVVIAHRLSTVRDSDEIVVLQHGTIVERGRHDALVAAAWVRTPSWSRSDEMTTVHEGAREGDLVLGALGGMGTPVDCSGLGRLDLEGPQVLWLVAAGAMDLFAVDAVQQGHWHHLGRLEAGSLLLGPVSQARNTPSWGGRCGTAWCAGSCCASCTSRWTPRPGPTTTTATPSTYRRRRARWSTPSPSASAAACPFSSRRRWPRRTPPR